MADTNTNNSGTITTTPLQSLINSGTKLWLDSIDPEQIGRNREWGATGATSNPIIVSELVKKGLFDDSIARFFERGLDNHDTAWQLTDLLVAQTQDIFRRVWQETAGDDGYASFELDPLLEDPEFELTAEERTRRYVSLGKQWGLGQPNGRAQM